MRHAARTIDTQVMDTPPVTRFEAFTPEHLGLLAGFLVVCVVLAIVGRAHRGTTAEVRFRRGFALLIPCFTVPMQALQLLPGPLQRRYLTSFAAVRLRLGGRHRRALDPALDGNRSGVLLGLDSDDPGNPHAVAHRPFS